MWLHCKTLDPPKMEDKRAHAQEKRNCISRTMTAKTCLITNKDLIPHLKPCNKNTKILCYGEE